MKIGHMFDLTYALPGTVRVGIFIPTKPCCFGGFFGWFWCVLVFVAVGAFVSVSYDGRTKVAPRKKVALCMVKVL